MLLLVSSGAGEGLVVEPSSVSGGEFVVGSDAPFGPGDGRQTHAELVGSDLHSQAR
jgi:hypothetical protein